MKLDINYLYETELCYEDNACYSNSRINYLSRYLKF